MDRGKPSVKLFAQQNEKGECVGWVIHVWRMKGEEPDHNHVRFDLGEESAARQVFDRLVAGESAGNAIHGLGCGTVTYGGWGPPQPPPGVKLVLELEREIA